MITKTNYLAPENRYMCDECSEAITNPICPFCLTTEIKAWLTLYPSLRQELMPKIKEYLEKINNRITSYGIPCIKCRDTKAFVCPYCFTHFVFNELAKINASKIVLKEFFQFFNYDFHHTGYTKYAERIGVV